MNESRPIEILLVEDSPEDVCLMQEALKEAKIRNQLNVVNDGAEALDYVRLKGKYQGAVRPELILLDLNLPKVSGKEVLAELKADPELKNIPVVVLTISKAERDIFESYQLHANAFITKPLDLTQFLGVIKTLVDFWLTVVKLPKK